MRKETLAITDAAIEQAKGGQSSTILCRSRSVAKDVLYRIKRRLRREDPATKRLISIKVTRDARIPACW